MKKFTVFDIISIIIILFNFLLGIYLAPNLPDRVPIHWNFQGEIDSYGGKEVVVWQMPLFIAVLYILLYVVPFLDPKKKNYKDFINYYGFLKLIFVVFLSVLLWLSTVAAFYDNININQIMPMLIGILFIIIGFIMPKVKQNYFVGFRTPWAIENEEVWGKTQKLGSIAFVVGGFLIALTSFIQKALNAYFVIFIIVFIVLCPLIYSYIIYQKLKKQ